MTMRIRCGLVGLGRISAKHLEAYTHHKEHLDLVAVCDTDEQALSSVSAHLYPQRFNDLSTMLKETKLDLVSVCTPSGLHPQQGIMAAEAGCHVIVEKPMATRWEDGIKLYQTCQNKGVQLFVVLQNRYNPTIVKLKQAIEQGRFGKIYMIVSNVFWTRPQSYYDQAAWRGTWSLDGGAFMNQASHYVDMLAFLGGPVLSVQSSIATLARNIEAEDTGAALIRFAQGTLATLNVTMLTYPHNREGSLTVLGERGHVKIGGTAMNQLEIWDFADKRPEDEDVATLSYTTDSVYGNGHTAFYGDVIHCLQTNTAAVIDGNEGLKSLELLTAIYEGAKQHNAIFLPLSRNV